MTPTELQTVLDKHRAWLRGEADGSRANLRMAYLSGAYLSGAVLREAVLRGAKVYGACWPAPTMLLLASWGALSPELTRQCMRFDAANHPEPRRFEEWAAGGLICPYFGIPWGRAVYFEERRADWVKGDSRRRPWTPIRLAQALLAACCDLTPPSAPDPDSTGRDNEEIDT